MRRILISLAFAAFLAVAVLTGVAGAALADSTTYSIQIGNSTYTMVKPNESAAVYTDGSSLFVTAIGAIMTEGRAQPNAVPGTINGFPVYFIVARR